MRFEPTRSCMQWILNPFCKHLGRLTTADLWLLRAMKFRCENACCAAIVFCCVGNEIGTRDGTRTRNLLLRREALYPLGHTSCCKMHKRTNDHFRHRRATAGRSGRPCKGQRQRLQTRRRQQVPRLLLLLLSGPHGPLHKSHVSQKNQKQQTKNNTIQTQPLQHLGGQFDQSGQFGPAQQGFPPA